MALVTAFSDDVFERLAVEVAADLGGAEAEGAVDELGGGAADVRGDEGVGGGPEGVFGWEGLGVGDVEGGADAVLVEGVDEGIALHDGAAGGVNEEGSAAHKGELGRADEALGFGGEGDGEDNNVGLREEGVEVGDGVDFS